MNRPVLVLLGAALIHLALEAQPDGHAPWQLRISGPEVGSPLFGPIDVTVELVPTADTDIEQPTIEQIELFVDGRSAGAVTVPPYEWTVDVGQENVPHLLEARARAGDHQLRATWSAPAFSIDQEITAELRQLYVTVSASGRAVTDLERNELTVLDDGEPQEIVTFGQGGVRLQAAILIDSSASMRHGRLRHALAGARQFVAELGPDDEASVMLFSDRLLGITEFSGLPSVALDGLERAQAHGGTALADHLYLALKQLENRLGRRVLVVYSDGVDSHSSLTMQEVRWLAQRSRSMIYWVRTGKDSATAQRYSSWKGPEQYRAERRDLQRAVVESGGRVIELDRIEDAPRALEQVLLELRSQYVIGYYPTAVRHDGSWHRLEVKTSRRGARVRSRLGYLDVE